MGTWATTTVTLLAASLGQVFADAPVPPADEGASDAAVILKRFEPAQGSALLRRRLYRIEVDADLIPSLEHGTELTIHISINGQALFPAKLLTTAGVGAKGKWAWLVRPRGCRMDVVMTIVGKNLESSHTVLLVQEKRAYSVVVPRLLSCRRH